MTEERRLAVLRAIVQDYVETREPVGSRALVDRHHLGVSPATIRNDMAALEEEGLIAQPHTSAGRVPTDAGYRALLGQAYLLDGRFVSAEMALRDALALSPNQPKAVIRLALAQIGRNNQVGAHETLAAAPADTPQAERIGNSMKGLKATAVASEKPASLKELAELSGRHVSNLSRTLRTMERYRLVRLEPSENGTLVPTVPCDRVVLEQEVG